MSETTQNAEKLVRMANQIGAFFSAYPEPVAIEGIAEHLKKFWSAKMRAAIVGVAASPDGKKLDPVTAKAVMRLSE